MYLCEVAIVSLLCNSFTLPISLNSLDLAGVRLLSPRDSQILADDATKLKEELDEDLALCVVSFPDDQ